MNRQTNLLQSNAGPLVAILSLLTLASAGPLQGQNAGAPLQKAAQAEGVYLNLPLSFELQSEGAQERYVAQGKGYAIGLERGRAVIGLTAAGGKVVSVGFAGGKEVNGTPEDQLPGKVNHYTGNDPSQWKLGRSTFGKVAYKDIYPGIDVVYYGNQRQLEFDFVVSPGTDPRAIRMKIGGAQKLAIDASGALVIAGLGSSPGNTPGNTDDTRDLKIALPTVYQDKGGVRSKIAGRYELRGRDEVAFALDSWDRTKQLVIDPTLVYSGMLGGGTNFSAGNGIALDSSGNIYISGNTYATDFPAVNAAQSGASLSGDGFVMKINAAGTALVYSTYLGGSGYDALQAIAVDSTGAAWVTGQTQSADFPLLNSTQAAYAGNTDAVVAKFSATGTLLFSTFLGGNGYDNARGIAVDSANNAYVAGETQSSSFPTSTGALLTSPAGFENAFVTKFSSSASSVYSTLMGGSLYDGAYGIAVDSSGSAYVTGFASSSSFVGAPGGGAQTTYGGSEDAFVAKLNPAGSALQYFTFLGGSGTDIAQAIALDSRNNAYVAGSTTSTGLATSGAAQTSPSSGYDGFVAKLNSTGSALTYFSYLGGNRQDFITGLAVDSSGNAYVGGYTDSSSFPSVAALQPNFPGNPTSLFTTSNTGGSWSGSDNGINGAVLDVSFDPGTSGIILAATENGVFRTANNGTSWTQSLPLSYVVSLARSGATATSVYALSANNVYLSSDNGVTWPYQGALTSGNFQGLVADPATATTVYAYSQDTGVYVSTNAGATWTAANSGLPVGSVPSLVATSDGSLFASVPGFGIYKSTNQGTSWSAVNTGIPAGAAFYAHSLAASGTAVYAGSGSLYKTTNGGANWSTTAGAVPNGAYVVGVAPSNSAVVLATASGGSVYASADGGATWNAAGSGISSLTQVTEFAFDPLSATHAAVVAPVSQAGFVAELNAAGSAFPYSTWFGAAGGNSYTTLNGLTANSNGDVFITGSSSSDTGGVFPATTTAFQGGTFGAWVASISAASATCSVALGPTSQTVSGSAQTLGLSAVAPGGCSWSAASDSAWATVTRGSSDSGVDAITVQLAANSTGASRTATITAGSASATITQADSGCSYALSSTSFNVPALGGTASIGVTTASGCPWSVTNAYPFAVTVTSGASGTGNGTINLSVAPNNGFNSENFYLNVGPALVSIGQAGACIYTFAPKSASFGAAGGTGSFGVTASNNACSWFASTANSWITLTGTASGTGSGTVNYSVGANSGSNLTGSIDVGGFSFPVTQSGTNATGTSTTTTLTSSLNPSAFGTAVTLTATVSPSAATGTVTFKDGATSLGTGSLTGGTATLSVTSLSVSSHSLTAVYGGDSNYLTSTSSPVTQVVNRAQTTVTLTSSANPANVGSPVTLTAAVSPSAATGSVTFSEGGSPLGTGTLSNGIATLGSVSLSAGSHTLTASYAGDSNDAPGQSSVLNQTVAYQPPSITTSSLPSGQTGTLYGPVTVQALGGSGSYSWSASGFPAGITISTSGTISGTSSVPFSGSVNITVTDSISKLTASASLGLSLTSGQIVISGATNLGSVTVGGTVSGSFSAQGGTPPYTWSLSGAPGGFSVDSNGKVTGVATSAGNGALTLVVNDSTPNSPLKGTVTLTYSAFGLVASSLPSASTLSDYSASLNAAGGTPPYTFSATGLPPGLSLSGSTISGRPQATGTFSVAVKASDSKGLSASASLSLTVTGAGPLQISSTSLANGTVNQPYSQTLSASGGSPAYTWSQSGGVLPPGLSLNSSGTVFGSPNLPGSYSFGVQANDTSGGQVVGAVSINVQPAPVVITNGPQLPSGIAGASYPAQTLGATGGVPPYTFSLKGSLPDGLALAGGQITGTPGTPGTFGFTVIATDSSTPALTGSLGMSVTIRPNSADLVLSAGSVSFAITAGTSAVPSASGVTISSSDASQVLNFSVDSSSASWIKVNGGSSTPGSLSVGLSNAALSLDSSGSPYAGTVVVTCTSGACTGKSQTIGVFLTITAPPPQLSLTSSIFSFVASTSNPQSASDALGIQNTGGGKLTITSVSAADSWLTVGSFPASVLPGPGAAVTITANPGSLKAGYYTSTVTVASSAGNASVPVTLLISSQSTMVLGPDGTQFSMPQGGALGNSSGSFLVSVSSTTPTNYSASVLPGASWLRGGGSGTASSSSPGTVNFSVDAASAKALAAGAYYGTIRVTGTGIVNTPQDFQVVLSVTPASTPVVPDPQPGGLLFLSAASGPLPPQTIRVFASSSVPLPFQASATVDGASGWLTIGATGGSTIAGTPAQILVSADSTGLGAGVYTGTINFASGPAVRSVNVTLVVEPPVSGASASFQPSVSGLKPAASAPVCANAKLVPAPTGLVSNFAAPASWPTPISLKLVDTCGSIIGKGQIVATFSNGDPPLALSPVDVSAGLYSGTWTPRKSSSQTIITAQATASGYAPASIQVQGQVTPNAAPQLVPNGTLDVFNPQVGGGLGPGNIVQIYGTSLSAQPITPTTLPLPTKVGGTQVLIGGITAPLFYVSPNQVNAQIPFELLAGQQYQVIVNANGALTTPQPIQLNAGAPALLQFTSGLVIAQHPDGTLISDTAPAIPGEFIVLYMTGLGATDVDVPTGQASPSDPLARVLDVPTVTLDNVPVPLLFAGLTPGLVGLYQINIQVPAGLADHTFDLGVSQSGVISNTTSLPVKTP